MYIPIGKARVLQHKLDKETENYFLRAVEVEVESQKGTVNHVISIASLAAFYYRQKDLPRALEHYEEALRIHTSHDNHSAVTQSYTKIISNIKAGKLLDVDEDGHSYIMEMTPYSPGYAIVQRA
jgi:tetratricopeptide (TPR) repeat protein